MFHQCKRGINLPQPHVAADGRTSFPVSRAAIVVILAHVTETAPCLTNLTIHQ